MLSEYTDGLRKKLHRVQFQPQEQEVDFHIDSEVYCKGVHPYCSL